MNWSSWKGGMDGPLISGIAFPRILRGSDVCVKQTIVLYLPEMYFFYPHFVFFACAPNQSIVDHDRRGFADWGS